MYILASQSPRRKQLFLEDISSDFVIEIADIDEHVKEGISPIQYVREMAYRKGEVIFKNHKEDAYKILKMLSNNVHQVITSYCIFSKDKVIQKEVISEVIFNELDDDLINRYIESGSPLDKAGAYGIQDGDKFPIVKEYKGSYKNIVGFPTESIIEDLKSEL